METKEEYLTPEELASRLKLSRRTVYSWLKAGRVPFVRIGRLIRVPASAVMELMTKGGI